MRDIGEFGFIARIADRVRTASDVLLGIGDDAAILAANPGEVSVVTSDMLVEGVHFDLSFTDPFRLGRKALAVNLSDVAAMGARPRHALLSLGIPTHIDLAFLEDFVAGFLSIADEHETVLVGGDTCSARSDFSISVTLMGTQTRERTVTRGGARPGDLVCVTGSLGDSALGLQELGRGLRQSPAISRHLDPFPRVGIALCLAEAGLPTSMIDVSDGFLADLGHIAEMSGVGARVRWGDMPLSPYFTGVAGDMIVEAMQLALAGGEDYELVFTVPADRLSELDMLAAALPVPVSVVGDITALPGVEILGPDGDILPLPERCFDHFRRFGGDGDAESPSD